MLALVLFSSVVCLFAASYVTAAGVVWLINRFIFMLPFDLFAYFQCPFSTTCIEYAPNIKTGSGAEHWSFSYFRLLAPGFTIA